MRVIEVKYDRKNLIDMVNYFKKKNPKVSLRHLCELNGYNSNYIHQQTSNKCKFVSQEVFDKISNLLEIGSEHPERYGRKEFTRKCHK